MTGTDNADAGSEPAPAEAAPSIDWIRDFVRRWLEAWNSHDAEQVLGFLTDDVEIRDDSWPKTMHGHGDAREFLEALWRAIPDMTFELRSTATGESPGSRST